MKADKVLLLRFYPSSSAPEVNLEIRREKSKPVAL